MITGRAAGVQDYFAADGLFYFELGDATDLARSLIHLVGHPDEVSRVVKRGQQIYLAHRWSKEREGLVARIAELLKVGDYK